MAKGNSSGHGYAPLNYLDRLKIRAATKHLHSRYASVRHAAHNEIARILKKRQQSLRARLDPRKWARRAWDRANYGKLHKCGNCEHATRDQAMFRQHQNAHMREAARSDGPAATPGLRERHDGAGATRSQVRDPLRRAGDQVAANQDERRRAARPPAQDVRHQAGLLPQDRKPQPAQRDRQQPKPASRPAPGPVTNATLRQEARKRAAATRTANGISRTPLDVVARPDGPRVPAAPKLAPLPHETIRAPRAPRPPKPRLRMPRLRARA